MSVLKMVLFLWTILVQVVAPTPQAARRLLAICPYVAELLVVVTLSKNILSFVKLNFGCNMTKA
jgi:hypothetical protein